MTGIEPTLPTWSMSFFDDPVSYLLGRGAAAQLIRQVTIPTGRIPPFRLTQRVVDVRHEEVISTSCNISDQD